MAEVTELPAKGRGSVRGRVGADKQEAVVKIGPVRDRLEELINLHHAAEEKQEEFAAAVKATAGTSGIQASVLRRFVIARSGENFGARRRDCRQLELLFDEIGE